MGFFKNVVEAVTDAVETVVENSKKRQKKRQDKRAARKAMSVEYNFYVDPSEYETTTDPKTGITTLPNGTRVLKGDPLYFDYSSEIYKYKKKYGVPSNWRTLGGHWNVVPVVPSGVGVGKEVRQNTAVRQKWIPTATNPNTLAKLYTMNKGQKAFAERMLNYAKTGSSAVGLAQKTLDVASSSPAGMVIKIFKTQADIILGVFEAQIKEADIENDLIRKTLKNKGINVDERVQQLKQIAKDEDWDLYNSADLQRPSGFSKPKVVRPSSRPNIRPNVRPVASTPRQPITGGNVVAFKPTNESDQNNIVPTIAATAGVSVGVLLLYNFLGKKK